jgi:hypothetical protein
VALFAALALAAVSCPAIVSAQDCSPADISLSSQADIDGFQTNHGPCDRVTGELKIDGGDISGLAGLAALAEVRYLRIWNNPQLQSLAGLNALAYASTLHLYNNPLLANLQGLAALAELGTLQVSGNAGLLDLQGLEVLENVGYLIVSGNASLRSLAGLSGLQRVGANEFRVSGNGSLESLDGLESLHTVVGNLIIEDNDALRDIDGLSSLTTVTIDGGFNIEIQRNAALADLDGLAGLSEIPGSLIIHLNDSLSDIGGLSNLEEVGVMLHIATNPALPNLDGLASLTSVSALGIVNNASLADINGLAGLEMVHAWFEISWNPLLTSLGGLTALTRVGVAAPSMGALIIQHNAGLQSLSGLHALEAVQNLALEYNPALADCGAIAQLVDPLDDFAPGPGPGISGVPDIGDQARIQFNGEGCGSVNDILAQAPLFDLNAGISDAWFNPETAGQGFFIIVFPQMQQVFMAWFTYDMERPPPEVTAQLGEPGHRWITAQGAFVGNTAVLTVHVAEGGVFDSAQPAPGLREAGEILLEFTTCNAGTVSYDIPSIGRQGLVPVERIALDNVALCYALEKAGDAPAR